MQKMLKNISLLISCICLQLSGSYAQVNTEALRREFQSDTLLNSLSVSYQIAQGNTEYFGLSGGYRLDAYFAKFYSFVAASIEYKKVKDNSIVDKGFAHFRIVYNATEIFAPEVFYQKEFNKFISMKDRNLFGASIRVNLHKLFDVSPDKQFDLVLASGMMAENELLNFESDSTANTIRSTNYLSCHYKLSKIVELSSVLYFQVAYDELSNYRILNDTSIKLKVTDNIAFVTGLNYRYNNTAHPSLSKSDLNIINGLQIIF